MGEFEKALTALNELFGKEATKNQNSLKCLLLPQTLL